MAVVYYPKSSLIARRDTISSSFEEIVLATHPNVVLYFNTSSQIEPISLSMFIDITASQALTASYISSSTSYVGSAETASYLTFTPATASYAFTASVALNAAASSDSSSWASQSLSSSVSISSSFSTTASFAITSAFASNFISNNAFSRGATIYNSLGIPNSQLALIVWRCPFTCTATSINSYFVSGSGAAIMARHNNTGSTPGLMLSGGYQIPTPNTWYQITALQSSSFVSGDKLEIMVMATTGAVTQVAVQLDFTR